MSKGTTKTGSQPISPEEAEDLRSAAQFIYAGRGTQILVRASSQIVLEFSGGTRKMGGQSDPGFSFRGRGRRSGHQNAVGWGVSRQNRTTPEAEFF
jgi:hypothetical protein